MLVYQRVIKIPPMVSQPLSHKFPSILCSFGLILRADTAMAAMGSNSDATVIVIALWCFFNETMALDPNFQWICVRIIIEVNLK